MIFLLGDVQLSNARCMSSSDSTPIEKSSESNLDETQRESAAMASQQEAVQAMSLAPLPNSGSRGDEDAGDSNRISSGSEATLRHPPDETLGRSEDARGEQHN